jgi:hypothetical protein
MFSFHLIISEKVNYTPFKRLGRSRLWRGRGIHLIRTVIVNESLILIFVFYLEWYSITSMRRCKRKSTSSYATAAGAKQSKTRKDVPVPVTEHLPHVDTLSRSIPNTNIAKTTADVGPTQNVTLLYSREEVGHSIYCWYRYSSAIGCPLHTANSST